MSAALLERVAQGDARAFDECLARHGDLVWSLARRFSPSTADAEDATQDIFLHLWRSAARYDAARGTEAVFIATLARRLLIDRYRDRRRRPVEVVVDDFDSPWAAREDGSAAVEADAQRAASALQSLRPEQQQVIALSVVDGLSQSEIATAVGMPLGTVKTLMRRGLLELRAALGGKVKP
ncbi:MAG: sigma-70 family RNA polymerase sigma factor [Steroidobacteraceae bacterium]